MAQKDLKLTFEPNTIEHLGVRMYSTLPPVLAELIANAYDADADTVRLLLKDKNGDKEIIIADDGTGMDFNEINTKFLSIGRNRRKEDTSKKTKKGRKVIGKKGLGKLSFFGIAHEIVISTQKKGKKNVFRMRWEDIKKAKGEYKPRIIKKNKPCPLNAHGTKILLKSIKRESVFNPEDLANSLSKMFIWEPGFRVTVQHNSKKPIPLTNERRYEGLEKEIEWKIPAASKYTDKYGRAGEIRGHLIATRKPIPPNTNMRGIVLFSRKKLVNHPEYFSESTSSHFFSYLTGWLEVDFVDELKEDVISTNRQSLDWGHDEMQKLREHLRGLINWLERDWRQKRNEKRELNLTNKTGISLPDWFSKVPEDIRSKLAPIIKAIVNDSELPDATHLDAVKKMHEIVPEYPTYHWRHLHNQIKTASESDYTKADYYRAFTEAAKRYINAVKDKSGCVATSERGMMGEVFGDSSKFLRVAQHIKKPTGADFPITTLNNIEEGQKHLSMGVVAGCRNPVSHEEISDLRDSKLFTEKDCLDALSLLSHLFSRLDVARKKS